MSPFTQSVTIDLTDVTLSLLTHFTTDFVTAVEAVTLSLLTHFTTDFVVAVEAVQQRVEGPQAGVRLSVGGDQDRVLPQHTD